jgi:large subunit ribosomal protein L18e
MGFDRTGVDKKKRAIRHHSLSSNPYLKLLVKLYKQLAARTTSRFNKTVHSRLLKSRSNRAPASLSRIATVLRRKTCWLDTKKTKAPIAVVVGDILDDIRQVKIPAMKICALRFSRSARNRIEGAGGECITFDQLALLAPSGKNTFLMRGRRAGRESLKHFGAAGLPGSHVKPYASRGAERKRSKKLGIRRGFTHTH